MKKRKRGGGRKISVIETGSREGRGVGEREMGCW